MTVKRDYPEARLQKAVLQYLMLAGVDKMVYFHPANEGRRTLRTGAYLKSLGMLPGVADLVMIHDGRAYFLELKAAGQKPSPTQWDFAERIGEAGGAWAYADNINQAITILRGWGLVKRMVKAA